MSLQTDTSIDGVVTFLRAGADGSEKPSSEVSRLASLPVGALSSRFCAWRGASDRRYVASVYRVDREAADVGLPAFEGYVLMAVERGPLGRRILAVSTVERHSERLAAVALGVARGADEWHVHLLADDRYERSLLAADLRERHGDAPEVRCA